MGTATITIPARVRTVQRGSITIASGATSNTAAITAVADTTKTILNLTGFTSAQGAGAASTSYDYCAIYLTNSTTVTATRGGNTVAASVVNFEVIELY